MCFITVTAATVLVNVVYHGNERHGKGGSYGNKILYKNLDLTQDFPNKISFHF